MKTTKLTSSPGTISDSPVRINSTQENPTNLDVVWDWDSPQANRKHPKKCQKRLATNSPKAPFKRHLSENTMQEYEKLQLELKSLREELEGGRLSPVEEAEYHDSDKLVQLPEDVFDELMDENIDEQLLAVGEELERDANESCKQPSPMNRFKKTDKCFSRAFDELLTGNLSEEFASQRVNNENVSGNCDSRVEFHRTQSYEMSTKDNYPKICTQDQIEQKRLEAIGKLMAKKQQTEKEKEISKCTLEEIERKRLEALAKIQAKKQREFIERKRQEAIKRLQLWRQKNAVTIKSSLTQKFDVFKKN
ncbi:unnamed protein product [Phyllotreta striolata]|uniref:Uncharacterized protein n=1 Tax=Phyllotreta striolata TaxID=444603 RepID=A0A9N9TJI3_PHYSR|nr:unnamed protein product [Phyllotreta striolata]